MRLFILVASVILASSMGDEAAGQNPALDLSRSFGYLDVHGVDHLDGAAAITVEAWVYWDPAANGGSEAAIARKNLVHFGEAFILRRRHGVIEWVLSTDGDGLLAATGPPLSSDRWVHVAGTFDGVKGRVYYDGELVGEKAAAGKLVDRGGVLRIGNGLSGESLENWGGAIDELRIWKVARSADELRETMARRVVAHPQLMARWGFDGDFRESRNRFRCEIEGREFYRKEGPPLTASLAAPAYSKVGQRLTWWVDVPSAVDPESVRLHFRFEGGSAAMHPNDPMLEAIMDGSWSPLEPIHIDGQGLLFEVPMAMHPGALGAKVFAHAMTGDKVAPAWTSEPLATRLVGSDIVVSRLHPARGPITGRTLVRIEGQGLRKGLQVFVGPHEARVIKASSERSMLIQIPPGPTGSAALRLVPEHGAPVEVSDAFEYLPELVADRVVPVVPRPGAPVWVHGRGFDASTEVWWDGLKLEVQQRRPGQIRIRMPKARRKGGVLTLLDAAGQSSSLTFDPLPTVASIYPTDGPARGGSIIQIHGAHFHPGTQVLIGGALADLVARMPNSLAVRLPPGSEGHAQIELKTASGGQITLPFPFRYRAP